MDIGKPKIAIRGSKLPLLLLFVIFILFYFLTTTTTTTTTTTKKYVCGKEQRVDGYSLCIRLNLEYFLNNRR